MLKNIVIIILVTSILLIVVSLALIIDLAHEFKAKTNKKKGNKSTKKGKK